MNNGTDKHELAELFKRKLGSILNVESEAGKYKKITIVRLTILGSASVHGRRHIYSSVRL